MTSSADGRILSPIRVPGRAPRARRRTATCCALSRPPCLPVRAWRVDLDPSRTRWSCAAPGCLGTELKRRRAPQVALGHLAEHAAAEPLPGHLRTCRCQSRGCVWHPRHRGCDGPVSLVVFRSRGGATWQLAHACTACARSIPHAAQLPPPPQLANDPRRTHARQTCTLDATAVNGLDPLLTYLDAALAPGTKPAVRLFALLCLLRADRAGEVRLPHGLLRGCRLAHRAQECAAELAGQAVLVVRAPRRRGGHGGGVRADQRQHRHGRPADHDPAPPRTASGPGSPAAEPSGHDSVAARGPPASIAAGPWPVRPVPPGRSPPPAAPPGRRARSSTTPGRPPTSA